MRTAFFWFITQRVVAIPYRRFGTTCRSGFLTSEDGTDRLSQTSVRNCHYSPRSNPEKRSSRKYYCLTLTEMSRFKSVNTGVSQLLPLLVLFFRHLIRQVDLYFSVPRLILEIAFIYVLVIPGAVGHYKECDLKF